MSMFETSRWKVGQPTLRIVVTLSVVGVASYVIGACAGRRPPLEQREASARQEPELCSDGGTPADAGSLTYTSSSGPDSGMVFKPSGLCLGSNATLEFQNQDSREVVICFHKRPGGSPGHKSPFSDGSTHFRTPKSASLKKEIHGRPYRVIYDFQLSADGGCEGPFDSTGDGGVIEEGTTGTLEVGTGGTIPPDTD